MPSKEQLMAIGKLLAQSLASRQGTKATPKKAKAKAKAKAEPQKKGKSLKKVSGLAGTGYDEAVEAKD